MPVKKKAQPVALEAPKSKLKIPREAQIDFLRQMLRIRRLEERCAQAYGQGKIGGFCHLYIGQEAIAVGALAASRPDDYVITTYRDHGIALVRGMSAEAIFAELFGRVGGCSKGRGGSMHLFDKKLNFLGGHGIVGAHIPLGTGAAFAAKYRGEDRVALCFFGEGAVNNGALHESLNLAALWDLPVVYLCENNRYGMGTAVERVTSVVDLHTKAEAYDMAHGLINGMDVLEVYEEVKKAIAEARQGRPSFLELRTYRFRGHSMSDPIHSHYRTKEEVEKHREQDPISLLTASLEENGLMTEEDLKAMEREVSEEIKTAMESAYKSPEPDPSTVYDYVYQSDPYRSRRGG
ncbi:MAG TPA: pyruvate dehydrogenase (acetyl-transferring) E1 component subunit alpha [Planctomycetota bacterium]|nr:pyruvate dehydrogenase (acetyl-transferring) E1 component subunit alpha [Planctomycetota bacterium]